VHTVEELAMQEFHVEVENEESEWEYEYDPNASEVLIPQGNIFSDCHSIDMN
jgi:hypothetical protein